MDRTLQERGPHWFGLLAGHGAYSAGACRALCIEAEFRHRGRHRARTCPLNRQGTAAAHSHACFSKGCYSTASCTPLQHLWGSKAHTDTHTYKHTKHTHIHSHSCACAHTYKHKHARKFTQARTHTYTCARTNTQTRARTHAHAQMHRHTRAHVARVMDFANFSASLATLLHLSIRETVMGAHDFV